MTGNSIDKEIEELTALLCRANANPDKADLSGLTDRIKLLGRRIMEAPVEERASYLDALNSLLGELNIASETFQKLADEK